MIHSLLLDGVWDSSAITDYIWSWISAIAAFLCSVVAALMILFIIKIGFKIAKASSENDIESRSTALNGLIWLIIGFVICCCAATACGIIASTLIK